MTYPTNIAIDSYGFWDSVDGANALDLPPGWNLQQGPDPGTVLTDGAGRRGGRALVYTDVSDTVLRRFHFSSADYVVWGMAVQVGTGGTWPSGGAFLATFFAQNAGAFSIALVLGDNGTLELWNTHGFFRSTHTFIADSGGTVLGSAGDWHYIEVHISPSATTSSNDAVFDVYVDSVLALSATGFNYRGTIGAAPADTWVFPGVTDSTGTVADVYVAICDSYIGWGPATDPVGSRLAGDMAVECLFPASAGRFLDFVPTGAANNWDAVNENAPDEDSTYNESTNPLNADYFYLSALPGGYNSVRAVTAAARYSPGHASDTGFSRFAIIAYQGGGEYQDDTGSDTNILYYKWHRLALTTYLDYGLNFVFGTPWTLSDLSTMQFGYRFVSYTAPYHDIRVTQLAVEVALQNVITAVRRSTVQLIG